MKPYDPDEKLEGAVVRIPMSVYSELLYEMGPPTLGLGPLFEALERENAERKAKDDAYLAGLTPARRELVLLHRRIDDLENRYRTWWHENVAWRFAPDHPCRGHDAW